MNVPTLTLEEAIDRADMLYRMKHTETAARKIDEGLQEMQRNVALVLILTRCLAELGRPDLDAMLLDSHGVVARFNEKVMLPRIQRAIHECFPRIMEAYRKESGQ